LAEYDQVESPRAARLTMRSALVLNATYEPLSVVSARRAVCLVLSDKAEIIEDDGESFGKIIGFLENLKVI
jgi:hypothetical protein